MRVPMGTGRWEMKDENQAGSRQMPSRPSKRALEYLSQFISVAQSCSTFVTSQTAACKVSLSITNSQSLFKLMSIKSVMPSNHLCHPTISVIPLSSCFQAFQASGTFLMSQFFTSGGQNIGVSASALPMNTQD